MKEEKKEHKSEHHMGKKHHKEHMGMGKKEHGLGKMGKHMKMEGPHK